MRINKRGARCSGPAACRWFGCPAAIVLAVRGVWAQPVQAGTPAGVARPNFVVILGEVQGWTSTSVQMDDAVAGSYTLPAQPPAGR